LKVLLLGALGAVAQSFVAIFGEKNVIGVDTRYMWGFPIPMSHFIHCDASEEFEQLLDRWTPGIVVDLVPESDKYKNLSRCDERGIHYVNATVCTDTGDNLSDSEQFMWWPFGKLTTAHIVSSGMNPGAVNAMAASIVKTYGFPKEIIIWEYDDTGSTIGTKWPAITWCKNEAFLEICQDWAFEVISRGEMRVFAGPQRAKRRLLSAEQIPWQLLKIPEHADALLLGHEECIQMGWRWNCACKFLYALHPDNMAYWSKLWNSDELSLLMKRQYDPLTGSDTVGVSLKYESSIEHAWVQKSNSDADIPIDSNATCWLVAAGIAASVRALLAGNLEAGVFTPDQVDGWTRYFPMVERLSWRT
jgi:hypothetical protein